MTFTAWYSAWHCCSASRAAMLTGRLPPRTGVDSVGQGVFTAAAIGGLPRNETTFAELLGPAGFATGMLGKWHLGQREEFMPTSRGFDYYLGIPYSVDMGKTVWRNQTAAGFSGVLPLVEGTAADGFKIIEQPAKLENLTTRYVNAATGFMRKHADAGKRFVLYIPFSHVHNPQFCSPAWCGSSTIIGGGPAVPTGHGGTGSAVQEMDAAVGAIMDELRADPVLDAETLTFYTSDNGAPSNHALNQTAKLLNETLVGTGSNYPLRGFKGQVWEGGIRMPAIVRWKGQIKPGTVTGELAATYDIFTTMMRLADVALPSDRVIDGKDLTPILLGTGPSQHDCIINYHSGAAGPAVVRCGNYKLHFDTSSPQLYNLVDDPHEDRPLPVDAEPALQAIVRKITAARTAHMATVVPVVDQILLGYDDDYMLCSDPHSQEKYPHYPNCTMSPENWVAPWPPPPPPVPVPLSSSVGCYWDKGEPDHFPAPCDLPIVKAGGCPDGGLAAAGASTGVTLSVCRSLCAADASHPRYFAVQNGGTGCFCGDGYGKYGPSTACNMSCAGGTATDPAQACGGIGANSIYRVE